MSERRHHQLTFRGQDHEIPAGYGLCTRCGQLLDVERWLDQECDPGTTTAATAAKEDAS